MPDNFYLDIGRI